MLALVATFLVAAYLLGPELLSRWILGFVVPRKSVVQTRGEEMTRALVWASVPLTVAIVWTKLWWLHRGYLCIPSMKQVFSGLYSDAYFKEHQDAFFNAAKVVWSLNVALLWRLYLIIAVLSTLLDIAVVKYCFLRQRSWGRFFTAIVARLTLPKISEWHLLLSGMLLPKETLELHADVLTKSGTLYQGRVQDKMLGSDGALQTLTLASPRRFLREQFQEKRKENAKTKPEEFWRSIPGNLFVISGSEISSVNLRYIEPKGAFDAMNIDEKNVLLHLLQRLTEPPRE